MKTVYLLRYQIITLLVTVLAVTAFYIPPATPSDAPVSLPYKAAGLTERQAAAHLLSRLSFGAKPGEVDAVVAMGLEKWVTRQLNGDLPDDSLHNLLRKYDALTLSNEQILNIFPRPAKILREAIREGFIDKDSVNRVDNHRYREQLEAFSRQKGLRPEKELFGQFAAQKVLRAACSENQLQEVLTDFWFNHFNVSMTKGQCIPFIPNYERDAIRPYITGRFGDLLRATAQSPAMLVFLDNFISSGGQELKRPKSGNPAGLNENYAREVMELHTLGVDGGYTQEDVTQAARVLTGWTLYPMSDYGSTVVRKLVEKAGGEDKLTERGFIHSGDFLFVPGRHDDREKTVLGRKFPAGGGYSEGVELLDMLAHHPSTAKFISRKLAVRFVSDTPPQSLIDRMAKVFLNKDGNIREVLKTMIGSPEFWAKETVREKTKSPFELAISAIRALDARIEQPYQVYNWVNKMGQKLYHYQAPTGFPDKGQYWINTGSLLSRMNFGLALAAQRIPGIRINLLALNQNREPESASAALETYARLIMPERTLDQTISRLTPLLTDPELAGKIEKAAGVPDDSPNQPAVLKGNKNTAGNQKNNQMLAQVVGIIIGSPEFQRR